MPKHGRFSALDAWEWFVLSRGKGVCKSLAKFVVIAISSQEINPGEDGEDGRMT